MRLNENKVDPNIFDINLVFYNFLKKITQARFTDNQLNDILSLYFSNIAVSVEVFQDLLYAYVDEKIKRTDTGCIIDLIADITTAENLELFIFSVKLNLIKDLLLQEAKLSQTINLQALEGLDQLSLAYDKISTQAAYATRISGALLALLFFEKLDASETGFISGDTEEFLHSLSKQYKKLTSRGVEANQIFMLLFNESINQSNSSNAGANYEERIKNILISIGIPNSDIEKIHDDNDMSTEFDFFFSLGGKKYGISSKRTLRERYKQFIKTAQMSHLDVMIEITLGIDLTESMAQTIRKHGVYIFVADEVYHSKRFLQNIEGVFPATRLSKSLLVSLSSSTDSMVRYNI